MESFTSAVPLLSGRVEFLRCGDGNRTHVGSARCLDNIRLERKCIAGLFGVFFPDRGLLITVYSLLFILIYHPGLAISPWYRLVFGICSNFLGKQPPWFFCVSIYPFHYFSF